MSDLIRREDALALFVEDDLIPTEIVRACIEDLPAVQPDRIEQLEKELSTCRMAQVVMDNTVAKLTAERNKYESAWMTAEGKLADVEAERDRLRKALEGLMAHEPDYSDTLWQDARTALKGEKA